MRHLRPQVQDEEANARHLPARSHQVVVVGDVFERRGRRRRHRLLGQQSPDLRHPKRGQDHPEEADRAQQQHRTVAHNLQGSNINS